MVVTSGIWDGGAIRPLSNVGDLYYDKAKDPDRQPLECLFELIKVAYVNCRYDPNFVVTKENIDTLILKVELLRDITMRICQDKIKEYGGRSQMKKV